VRSIVSAAVLALVLVGASGCGGNGQTASERWADEVCSSIGDWRDQVFSIRNDVAKKARDGSLDAGELRSALDKTADETGTLVRRLRDAAPPETEAGRRAGKKLDEILARVSSLLASARSKAAAADSLPAAITAAGPDLSRAANEVVSGMEQLSRLDPAGELHAAFRDAKSCRDLRS
jgi:hypothetical protein